MLTIFLDLIISGIHLTPNPLRSHTSPKLCQQSRRKAQTELDEYKSKIASLKEVIEEHGLDADSLFAQVGIEVDGTVKQ